MKKYLLIFAVVCCTLLAGTGGYNCSLWGQIFNLDKLG
jgi:hypothetical protein